MSQITRCPHCATTFKVVADQLRISDGWVRCGQCKEVFDATEHLLVSEPEPLLPEILLPSPEPPAQPAAQTPDGVHVWGSAREAAPNADAKPHATATWMPADAEHAAALPADAAGGAAPIPLSSLLKQESLAPPPDAIAGYELPAAAQVDGDWPQEPPQEVTQEAQQQPDAGTQDAPAPALPAAASDTGIEPAQDEPLPPPPPPEALLAEEEALMPTLALPDAVRAQVEAEAEAEAEASQEPGFVAAARRQAFWRRPWVRAAQVLLCLVCVLALALQVLVQERDVIAARHPAAHRLLEQLCQALGCTVQAPRRIDAVVIDSSSFVKARHDDAGYELHMGVKNGAAFAVAMPALELTLTDAQDQVLLRRVLQPDELGAPAELAPGATWSTSVPVQVLQDAARVAGYRLLAFYP
ncbi:MAG: zinc-ribbon and DUF3426 domain-containing protein [Proteobacteria bacterium]|nr:zinc-ribbon and DUF3426 domain-containing protein [Pseudomonadota bacterium]